MGFLSLGSSDLVDVEKCAVLNDKLAELYSQMRLRLGDEALKPQGKHQYTLVDLDDDVEDVKSLSLNQRRPFKQGNEEQNVRIQNWLQAKLVEISEREVASSLRVLELYAGSGNFTRVISKQSNVTRILAVDIVDEALMKMKSQLSDKVGVRKHSLNSRVDFEKFSKSLAKEKFSTLVLDPPREGANGLDLLVKNLRLL